MTQGAGTGESGGVRPPWHHRTPAFLLTVVVGMAFADTSIVVLALPSIYGEFSTTIVTVSWVLTGYAVAVCLTALTLLRTRRDLVPPAQLAAGLVLFALACTLCGFAFSFPMLMLGRCLQGMASALLLAAAVPVLSERLGATRGRAAWNTAAAIGLAAGPAIGGFLTELFDWRAIFLAQLPVALIGLLAVGTRPTGPLVTLRTRTLSPGGPGDVLPGGPGGTDRRRRMVFTHSGLALLAGGLVGALFLGVLLVVEVWRFTPLTGALVVSALPAGMLLAVPAGRPLGEAAHLVAGASLLAAGLVGLAWLPQSGAGWAVPALALCGTGLGLITSPLDRAALPPDGPPARDGTFTVLSRHAGLVIGLLLIAPVLSGALESATGRAVDSGTASVLDARLPLQEKVSVALALRDGLEESPRGHLPDLVKVLQAADSDPEKERELGTELQRTVQDVLTRSFRSSFVIAAALALGALVPGLLLLGTPGTGRRGARPGRPGDDGVRAGPAVPHGGPTAPLPQYPHAGPAASASLTRTSAVGSGGTASEPAPGAAVPQLAAVAVLLLVAGSFLAAERVAGAGDFGAVTVADPCAAGPDPYPGDGGDAALQRVALSTLNGAACKLGMSREELVLGLDGKARFGGRGLSKDEIEPALRSGLRRAVDDAEKRDDLPGSLATGLGFLIDHAPVSWLIDRLGLGATD